MPFRLDDCCIVLLLDRKFIPGAQTLISSFRHSEIFSRMPIVLMSDDNSVINDPFLKQAAAKCMLLDEQFIERYADLPRSVVPDRHQRERVPKYTWYKFAAYQDLGYGANIFIDADMMLLRSPDRVLRDLERHEFEYAAAPSKSSGHFKDIAFEDFRPKWNEITRGLRTSTVFTLREHPVRFNSGFFVVRGRLLQADYMKRLFEIAKSTETHYEQSMNLQAMKEIAALFYELPVFFNLTRPVLDLALKSGCDDIAQQAVIQHYTFQKPWEKKQRDWTASDRMWHEEYARVQQLVGS